MDNGNLGKTAIHIDQTDSLGTPLDVKNCRLNITARKIRHGHKYLCRCLQNCARIYIHSFIHSFVLFARWIEHTT